MNGVECWGENESQQAAGQYLHERTLKFIAVGGWHNCQVIGDGEKIDKLDHVYCWGFNKYNQCLIPRGLNLTPQGINFRTVKTLWYTLQLQNISKYLVYSFAILII